MKWEYITTLHCPDLNKLGEDGWELIVVINYAHPNSPSWIFKRPLPEEVFDESGEDPNE